jgi:8-oxo-dGTP pyrophosphatase MutT (NUDIX family)
MPDAMLTFRHADDWPKGRVRVTWTDRGSRPLIPEVERLIDEAWAAAASRPGVYLFDGPMCRLESARASDDGLELLTSPTSYKAFLGTNMAHPELADRHGRGVLANPLGVSVALETADGQLALGRRNQSVAYYPGHVHPFAGALEPGDRADPFTTARRELAEELSLAAHETTDLRCAGLVEDRALLQPELILLARTALASDQIRDRVDRTEHEGVVFVAADELADVPHVMKRWDRVTPVAVASLLLWGRSKWGSAWFDRESKRFTGPGPISP